MVSREAVEDWPEVKAVAVEAKTVAESVEEPEEVGVKADKTTLSTYIP